jgi:hypothetical protein
VRPTTSRSLAECRLQARMCALWVPLDEVSRHHWSGEVQAGTYLPEGDRGSLRHVASFKILIF